MIASELRCLLWAVNSMLDLHFLDGAAVQAINNPKDWPKYRSLIDRLWKACSRFRSCQVKLSSVNVNSAARKIAKSVTHEGRVRSYL
ncbi:hypothetical protein V5N11_016362 [Cardamine amara subsp. amara]|uniref:RNase H type-1 domain-containing protein n=1 Tax=Cardamine amara subsp. amara TaxID=228776 RepID=A0ABD1AZ54_CARAN